jgi:Fe(3+) dicitrate transport protein
MDSRSTRTYLKHYIELDDTSSLETAVYYNKFHRNWEKIKEVYDNGTKVSGSSAAYLDIVKGEGDSADRIRLKNNNRDYDAYGIQTEYKKSLELAGITNNFTIGARYHIDSYDDDSWYNNYNVTGRTVTSHSEDKGDASGKFLKAESVSLYLVDEIKLTDKFTLTPGVRYETIQNKYDNRKDGSDRNKEQNQHDFWAPGIGFAYDFTESLQMFGGVHKGISTSGVQANAADGIRHEESISYELGLRYAEGAFAGEAVVFFNDISDYYDGESEASGAEAGSTVGDVETYGLELSAAYDFGQANNWSFSNPWYAAFTYTQTEIVDLNDQAYSGFFSDAEEGNHMPYIPEYQFSVGTGVHYKKVGMDISASFIDKMFSGADNDRTIGSHVVVDLSAYYDVTENMRLLANIHNLFDEVYASSHHPNYDRAGKPLTATIGFEVKF